MSKQPSKVIEAFTANGIIVGKITLHEFTVSTLMIMQKIKHPLLEGSKKKTRMTDMDILRLVFILANPAQEVYRLVSLNTAAFDEAVIVFSENLLPQDMPKVGLAINKLFERAMSTAPGSGQPEKKTAMTPLPASQREETASAGS